jgi:hypothetical protein
VAALLLRSWARPPKWYTLGCRSKALFEHPVRPNGIAYYVRHDDEALCYAIFDRARGSVREREREINLDQSWFWQLARRYRVGLSPG